MRGRFLAGIIAAFLWTSAVESSKAGQLDEGIAAYKHQDYTKALKIFSSQAEMGNASAQLNLGIMYDKGHGVPQDYAQAAAWYRKAADQGYAEAQTNLGRMYYNGQGVPQDYVQSYKWSTLAIARYSSSEAEDREIVIKICDLMAGFMTPAQIAQAQQLAKDWRPVSAPTAIASAAQAPSTTHLSSAPPPKHNGSPGVPPSFVVPTTPPTSAQAIDISGKVLSSGRITALTVDGTDVQVQQRGTFSVRRAIPLGDSDIKLVATDEWGQTAETTIHVFRTVAKVADNGYSPLNPHHVKAKKQPKAIALIIGVEKYETAPLAEFAENDARSFYDYAINELGVSADRVKLLTGAEARRLDIRKAIQNWVKPLIVRGQSDVVVYFSGHGLASDDGKDLFLLPYDGDRSLLVDSSIRRKEIIDAVVNAGAASATFFLDTCYSGGTRGKDMIVMSARPILISAKEEAIPSNVTVFAAAAADQLSSTLEATKHGLFSYYLMRGLEGEAAGGEHTITAAQLEAYLLDHIPAEAAKLGRRQEPQLIGDGNKVLSSW